MNFPLLNQVLRFEIFLHRDSQLRAIHIILGFKPISTHFQVSKHVIKAKDLHLALVDMAVERFIQKPPPTGTQLVKLPTLTKAQPEVKKVISFDKEVKVQSEELEEESEGESTENLVRDKDFEVFYHQDKTKDVMSASISSAVVVSEDQGAIKVPKAMVIENKLPDLLSLLEL